MKRILLIMLAMTVYPIGLFAQKPNGFSYERVRDTPAMKWSCPDIEK